MILLELNGKPYTYFTDKLLTLSLGTLAGEFSVTATTNPETQSRFPIKTGDSCRILVDSEF